MPSSPARRIPAAPPAETLTLPVDAVLSLDRLRSIRATLQRLALKSPTAAVADAASGELAALDRVIAAREAVGEP